MMFDKQSLWSDHQAITATAASTNVIDLGDVETPQHANGPITRGMGRGRDVPLRVQVTEAFDNLTSLTVTLQTDDDEAFGSPTDVVSMTVPAAALVAGYVLPMQYAPLGTEERYVRLNYTVTGTAPTAGKVLAGLVFGQDNWTV